VKIKRVRTCFTVRENAGRPHCKGLRRGIFGRERKGFTRKHSLRKKVEKNLRGSGAGKLLRGTI